MASTIQPKPGHALPALRTGRSAALFTGALVLLIALPLIALLPAAAEPAGEFWRHIVATVLGDYVANSLLLALGVALIAGVSGVATGWLVALYRFPGAALFGWALLLPLAFPAYILAFLYTDLTQFAGPLQTALRETFGWRRGDYWFPELRSLPGCAVVLGLALGPYVYATARASFAGQSAGMIEAARTLGRGPGAVFFRVALPVARPAIAAGVMLCVMEALADFGAVMYFGVDTFTVGVYRAWYAYDSKAVAAQLALALLACILAAILIERLTRGPAPRLQSQARQRPPGRMVLAGWRGAGAAVICPVPVVLGFLLPALWLARLALASPPELGWSAIARLTGNTVVLAALAAASVIVLGLLAAWAARQSRRRSVVVATRVAMLGYATPGAVIAVGLLIAIGAFDRALDALFGTGLVLSGTLAAVVYGLTVRFFAVGFGAIDAGFARLGPHLDAAARTLGASPLRALLRVHVPLLRPHLAVAAVLVAADVLKELPATMILRPFNFDTLAVEVFRQATTERLDGAALPALLIVAVGLIPALLIGRQLDRLQATSSPPGP